MFQSTELLISLMTLVILGMLAFVLYRAAKNNPDMQVGELITYVLVKRSWDGFMISIILLGIFEALTAASIQPTGEAEINPFIRTCGHAVITFIYVVAGVNFPIQLYRFVMSAVKKDKFARIMGKFTLAIGYGAVALFMPLMNLFTVASGIKQHHELTLLFMEWFNSAQVCRDYYLQVGLPADYSPWGEMQQILQVDLMVTMVAHPLLILLDGVHAFASGSVTTIDLIDEKFKERVLDGKQKKEMKNQAKKDLEDVKDPLEGKETKDTDGASAVEMVEEILTFYGFPESKRKSRAKDLIERTYSKYAKANDTVKQEAVLQMMSQLLVELRNKKLDETGKAKLREKIQQAFKRRPSEGGFGEDLPSPK